MAVPAGSAAPSDSDDLPVGLAAALRDAGLRWHPTAGDRFVVTDGTLDGDVFTVSDMVVEVLGEGSGAAVLGFNGTTEWALDSVPLDAALWLPREGQLRRLLGPSFRRLEAADPGYRVFVRPLPVGGARPDRGSGAGGDGAGHETAQGEQAFDGATAAQAYGRALLALIDRALA